MSEIPMTVLMPTFNVERYVREAVASIVGQTWRDFELLIVDDGSTDGTRAALAELTDPRIRILHMEHGGLAAALRLGLDLARGRYIARADGDDVLVPHRLAVQKERLDRAPNVVMVHSLAQPMDVEGRTLPGVLGEVRSSTATKWLLLWRNPIMHPTVMLRTDSLRRHDINFRPELYRAEEFDVWNRLALHGDFEILPEALVRYRLHPQSMTRLNPAEAQLAAFTRVISETFERYGVPIPPALVTELAIISGGTWVNPIAYRYTHLHGSLHRWLETLSDRFCARFGVGPDELAAVQAEQLVRWGRYMLNTSRTYAADLLRRGVRRRPGVARTAFFWAVAASLLAPARLRDAAARRAARRAPLSARVH